MLSGKLVRSSIILIPLLLYAYKLKSAPAAGFASFQGPGPESKAIPGMMIETRNPGLQGTFLLEGKSRPVSLRLQTGALEIMGGSRFRPGPPSGFYISPDGRSYLPGLPDESRVSLGFLGFAMDSDNRHHLGMGAIESESGPGLLYYFQDVALFYHPESNHGFLSGTHFWDNPLLQQKLYASIYRDTSGIGGFGSYRIAHRNSIPWMASFTAGRYPARDVNPETEEAFPGRKGKSGYSTLQFHHKWMELHAAGEDRGMDQFRFLRIRLISPPAAGLRWIFQSQALRTYRYNNDQGFEYFRSTGAGIRIGQRSMDLNQAFSLDPEFWAQASLNAGSALSGEISFVYQKGYFYLEARYLHSPWPVAIAEQNGARNSSIRFYRDLRQMLSLEAQSRNLYARYTYSEYSSAGGALLKNHFLTLQGRWCLQSCNEMAPGARKTSRKRSLNSKLLDQMKDESNQTGYDVDYHNRK